MDRGRDWPAIAASVLRHSEIGQRHLASAGVERRLVCVVGTGEATRPKADAVSLFFIRLFQFRLAAASQEEDAAASILACVDEELPADGRGHAIAAGTSSVPGQVLLRSEVNLPIARLVSMGLEYIRLSDELTDILAEVHEPDSIER